MFGGKVRFGFIVVIILSMTVMAISCKPQFKKGVGMEGGQLTLHTSEFPKSFNLYVNAAVDASVVFGLVYDTLLDQDLNTLEYKPLIAKSWTISEDKKEFTFVIDSRAKWADGQPITAEDVKFTYDTIMDPKNQSSVMRVFFSRLEPPTVIDAHTIKFTAKTVHYNNFEMLAGLNILPKHLYAGKDFNKDFNMNLPGASGPYMLSEIKEGRYFVLSRRKDYWARQLPHMKGTYNFAKIKYKVMALDVAFEAFKRGDFDIYDEISPKRWVTETDTEHFRKNWIVKQKIYNYAPRGIVGLALNTRNPLFQDLKVRQALAYLLDRKTIIAKIRFNEEKPITSYFPSLYAGKANNDMGYNPEKAKSLLAEAGFNRLDKDGVLVNGAGRRLEFSIYYGHDDHEKYLTIFAESCRQAGVKAKLERLSWATLIKKMDEYKFDTVVIVWTGSLSPDPEQLWHSRHLNEVGGSNLSGYNNPKVDRLIDSLAPIFDAQKRNVIIKQIDREIYKDIPYLLFWQPDYSKIFYKNIFGHPKTVTQKYSVGIIKYWWYDPEKVKKYREAVAKRRALPPEPLVIRYDDLIRK
jgi:microcin C transport system substrate-binding protein